MKRRTMHLYRLDVIYPEGSDDPSWVPDEDEWVALCEERGYTEYWGDAFRYPEWPGWPTPRIYRTRHGAEKRAHYLERFGAKVTIHKSLPVQWPGDES